MFLDNHAKRRDLRVDREHIAASGLTIAQSYEYDLDSNRTKRVEGSTTTTYAYDRTDQLVSIDGDPVFE